MITKCLEAYPCPAVGTWSSIGRNHRLVRALGGLGREVVVSSKSGEEHTEGKGAYDDFHGSNTFQDGRCMLTKGGQHYDHILEEKRHENVLFQQVT